MSEKQRSLCKDVHKRANDKSWVWPMMDFSNVQTAKFLEINWLSLKLEICIVHDLNNSSFYGKNIATNCSQVTVPVLAG